MNTSGGIGVLKLDSTGGSHEPVPGIGRQLGLALIDPWLRAHLAALDAALTRRFVQLATGILEQRSLLLSTIAESTAFVGTNSSNATQVRPIDHSRCNMLDWERAR
jgi:hypothetical protein